MLSFTDQTGRTIQLPKIPRRIISLVPSQTEFLFELGLNEEVVGITKFCVHPQQWFYTKTRVGGTKQLKMDVIHSLQPELIIGNKEENEKAQVEELAAHYPVWLSNVVTMEDAFEMIIQVGAMTGRERPALNLITRIKTRFAALEKSTDRQPKTCYLIWNDPLMAAGGDTFINTMLKAAGFDNVYKHMNRYPQVMVREIASSGCELLLLSSEPFPFKQTHKEEFQRQLPGIRIELVDGEMFSWYGSRLLEAASYIQRLAAAIKNP